MSRQANDLAKIQRQIDALEQQLERDDLDAEEEMEIRDQIDRLEDDLGELWNNSTLRHGLLENQNDALGLGLDLSSAERIINKQIEDLKFKSNAQGADPQQIYTYEQEIMRWQDLQNRLISNTLTDVEIQELKEMTKISLLRSDQKISISTFSYETLHHHKNLIDDIKYNKKEFQNLLAVNEDDEEKLLQMVLNTFIPDNSVFACYIINKGLHPVFKTYSTRPIETNHIIKGRYMSVTFDFKFNLSKDFRMNLIRISPSYNQPRRQFELEAHLHVYRDNLKYTVQRNDRETLQNYVCSQVSEVNKRLAEWQEYLEWKKKSIEKNQFWIVYNRFTLDNDRKIFTVHAPITSDEYEFKKKKIAHLLDQDVLLTDYDQSKSKTEWKPVKYPDFLKIGTLYKTEIQENEASGSDNTNNDDEEGSRDLNLVLYIDYSQSEDDLDLEKIPKEGFILNSVIGDLHTITIQQKGIERLQNMESVNNHLSDFIFDSNGAQVPNQDQFRPMDFLQPNLNNSQKSAIKKAIAAPDLFLMQGPPGTGKTTTIAEICNYYCSQQPSKRVLLASQSNLAVDNALIRLIDKNYIYPMRIGSRATEFGEKFLKNNVIKSWIDIIYDECNKAYQPHEKVMNNIAKLEATIDLFQKLIPVLETNQNKAASLQGAMKTLEDEKQLLSGQIDTVRKKVEIDEAQLSLISSLSNLISENNPEADIGKLEIILSHIQEPLIVNALASGKYALNTCYFTNRFPTPLYNFLNIAAVNARANLRDELISISNWYRQQQARDISVALETDSRYRSLIAKKESLLDTTSDDDAQAFVQINKDLKKIKQEIAFFDWTNYQERLHVIIRQMGIGESKLPLPFKNLLAALYPDTTLEDFVQFLLKIISDAITDYQTLILIIGKLMPEITTLLQVKQMAIQNKKEQIDELHNKRTKIQSDLHGKEKLIQSIAQHDQEINVQMREGLKSIENLIQNEIILSQKSYSRNLLEQLTKILHTYRDQNQDSVQYYMTWGDIQKKLLDKYCEIVKNNYKGIKDLEDIYAANVNILGLTCAESGKRSFYANEFFRPFDVVIVDEVSRATPPELLLPLLLGKKVILMGDHKQLPPVLKEGKEETEEKDPDMPILMAKFKKMFSAMLFNELFLKANDGIKEQLNIQYRFHPQIMHLVNLFYQEKPLECGIPDPDTTRTHGLNIPFLLNPDNHAIWVDSSIDHLGMKTKEDYDRHSAYNMYEIDLIGFILLRLNEQLSAQGYHTKNRKKIGIITFYGAQIKRIRKKISEIQDVDKKLLECMEIRYNTVDKFQGMERDIILVSFVRTKHRVQDFVRNYHRINVAISRARLLLMIIGNAEAYREYEVEVVNPLGKTENQKVYSKMISIIQKYQGFVTPQSMKYEPISLKNRYNEPNHER